MTLRILVCVPTYNNPGTIARVVSDLEASTAFDILIVDDGSVPSVMVPTSERVHLIRHPKNLGKGAAIQSAIAWAVARGFTHLMTIDGDGQHLAREVRSLVSSASKNPWDLIIGKRRMEIQNVPGISHFGRAFSNFWVGYQTGHLIEDSQSGFRIYPLFHVQNMRFWTRRFDFEIEVLIRLLWRSVAIREVDVLVFYPPAEERVSHFDKFRDNIRISTLNTILVVFSLLMQNRQPTRTAAAMAMGVLVGCSPLYGFHTLLVALFSFVFRLNAAVMFLGSQVSFPPLAILLVPFQIAVGRSVLSLIGHTPPDWKIPTDSLSSVLHFASDHTLEWMTGSLVTGVLFAAIAGISTWAFLAWRNRRRPAGAWTGRTRGGRLGNGFMKLVIRFCGLRAAYFCLLFIVPYFYIFAPKARRAASEYWRVQKPEAGFWMRQKMIFRQLFCFGQTLIDRAYQSRSTTPLFQTHSHGIEHLLEPVKQRQAVILVSAHIGSWDIAALSFKKHGVDGRFHMVHYQNAGLTFEKMVGPDPAGHVTPMLTNQSPILAVKQRLSEGEPVGLMADRAGVTGFELIPFLGKLAPFDVRPFRIAAACGSQLLFTYGLKQSLREYYFFATPSKFYRFSPAQPRALQIREWVAEYARSIETMLKRYPEQWFNFFPFFSSPPGGPESQDESATEQHHLLEPWRTPATSESELESGREPSGEPERPS